MHAISSIPIFLSRISTKLQLIVAFCIISCMCICSLTSFIVPCILMYCFIPQTMETVKQTFQKSAHPGNSKGSLSLRSAEREAAGDPGWRPPSWMLSRAIPGREPSNLHPHPRAMSVSGCLGCVRVGSDGISAVLTSFGVSQQTPFANFQVFIREFTVGGKRHRHHHQQQQQQKREGAYFCRFVNQKV